MNPEHIIQQQVEAYNQRDIDAFVACHHPQVELYTFSETQPFATGREKVREIYGDVFEHSPNLHTEVMQRIIIGNRVIDYETVRGRKGIEEMLFVAIYEVEDDMIRKAHFMRG